MQLSRTLPTLNVCQLHDFNTKELTSRYQGALLLLSPPEQPQEDRSFGSQARYRASRQVCQVGRQIDKGIHVYLRKLEYYLHPEHPRVIENVNKLKIQVRPRLITIAFHRNPARLTFVHSFDVINADQHL